MSKRLSGIPLTDTVKHIEFVFACCHQSCALLLIIFIVCSIVQNDILLFTYQPENMSTRF